VGPGGRRVWVTHSPRQRSFTLLDSTRPARTSVLRRLPSGVGVGAPHDIAFAPRGQRVWVTYWNSKHVGTYDSRTGRLLALGQVGTLPHHVAVGPERVWVTDHAAGTAVVIDPPARIRRRLPVGPGAHHVSILVGVAVAVSHDAGTAVAFREHGARIRSIRVGNGLHGVALVFNP
jgi:DNA-binding beta-propeller fold protein YncE